MTKIDIIRKRQLARKFLSLSLALMSCAATIVVTLSGFSPLFISL